MKKKRTLLHSLGVGLAVVLALVAYAYGFQVTKVDLAETKSEHRQEQLTRILRALAHPQLFEYDTEDHMVSLPVMVPCPDAGFEAPTPTDTSEPYITMTPACAEPRAKVMIEGFNFEPYGTGPINFLPNGSDVNLQIGKIEADENGHFEVEVRLSNRPSEEVQEIQAITRTKVGAPRWTQTARDTWDKIVETVFLALLATTFGTLLAIPLSFIAARNLMKDVKNSLLGMSLAILFIPVGAYIGILISKWLSTLSQNLTSSTLLTFVGFVLGAVITWWGIRREMNRDEDSIANQKIARGLEMLVIGLIGVLTSYLLSALAMNVGEYLSEHLGSLGFLGRFIRDLGDILGMAIGVMTALTGAGILSGFASKSALKLNRKADGVIHILQIVLTAAAGAFLFWLIALVLNWFYQYNNYQALYWWAVILGGLGGLALGIFTKPRQTMPTGLVVYFAVRTVFNAIRSIEPLVWAIIFVVWVGIGPFAGSMALALHTIAALGKLYSEQVENIMEGPLEAIQSTGANRLQTIIYGVIPQVVPPYVSFTMYRWDINVRMSTIIGFAGGGGIGFLLLQNINLLNYRAASAQMLAIAIVVAAMDYISSAVRERYV